jgi:glutaminase
MPQFNASRRDLALGLTALGLGGAVGMAATSPAHAQRTTGASSADAAVKAAYDQFKTLNEGKNADYIPALAKVPSNYFGIALVTPQGQTVTAGDIDPLFSIQSISKVFTMALVFKESGEDTVERPWASTPLARSSTRSSRSNSFAARR